MTHIFRQTSLKARLLATLHSNGGEFRGICALAAEVEQDRFSVLRSLRSLESSAFVTIIPGAPGRGHTAIIKVRS